MAGFLGGLKKFGSKALGVATNPWLMGGLEFGAALLMKHKASKLPAPSGQIGVLKTLADQGMGQEAIDNITAQVYGDAVRTASERTTAINQEAAAYGASGSVSLIGLKDRPHAQAQRLIGETGRELGIRNEQIKRSAELELAGVEDRFAREQFQADVGATGNLISAGLGALKGIGQHFANEELRQAALGEITSKVRKLDAETAEIFAVANDIVQNRMDARQQTKFANATTALMGIGDVELVKEFMRIVATDGDWEAFLQERLGNLDAITPAMINARSRRGKNKSLYKGK